VKEELLFGSGITCALAGERIWATLGWRGLQTPPQSPATPPFLRTTPPAKETDGRIHQGWFIFGFHSCTSGRGPTATLLPSQTGSGVKTSTGLLACTSTVPTYTYTDPPYAQSDTSGLEDTASKRISHFEYQKGD